MGFLVKDVPERDHDRIVKVIRSMTNSVGVIDRVDAYIAPQNLDMWPSFKYSKQEEALGKEFLFIRRDLASDNRRKEVTRLLLAGEKAVCVGSPGIGKSSEMNYHLMEFLQHMGDEGWPEIVVY
jgi:hypothetical protein